MQTQAAQLSNMFRDDSFAWELLNAQIKIEMSHVISGDVIAYLLQLYMRGVEKMNSIGDNRESYFKNKVTSLMTKQNVIKSLKQNPMKKKAKPGQVVAKPDKESLVKPKATKKQEKQQTKQLELQQKKKQLQMRMAYVASENGPQSLKRIIAQQDHRQQNITSKINKIMDSHEERLNERIKKRKLRTETFRSHSQLNVQQGQQSQMSPNGNSKLQSFLPDMILENIPKRQKSSDKASHKQLRRYHSLEVIMQDTPQKRAKKMSFEQKQNPKKSFS